MGCSRSAADCAGACSTWRSPCLGESVSAFGQPLPHQPIKTRMELTAARHAKASVQGFDVPVQSVLAQPELNRELFFARTAHESIERLTESSVEGLENREIAI